MIRDYYRPNTLDEALKLLENPKHIPIGGGTIVTSTDQGVSVVDLQNLGFNTIQEDESKCVIGSTTTLEMILKYFDHSNAMKEAIKIEASKNQRERITLAGLICASNGRSPLLTLLLAMNPTMIWQPGSIKIPLGEYLPQKNFWQKGLLISDFYFNKSIKFAFESIGKSPQDVPTLYIAIARWPSGRLRITAGGFGNLPILVMDGDNNDNLELAVENALISASDEWGSAEYRIAAGRKIVLRLKNEIE